MPTAGRALMTAATGLRVAHAQHCIRTADAVCFDVDSTVIDSEGIDELAAYLGVGEKVAALTAAAMGGSQPFHEALAQRLEVMKPTMQQLNTMLADHPSVLTPGVDTVISQLQASGKDVYFVSGGFRQMIGPVADMCNVSRDNIYANNLLFDESGSFTGYDPEEFTSRAGGKARCVAWLREQHKYSTVVMVGDGATDMEARELEGGADAFIGFGGVQVREKVLAGADWFIYDFEEMLAAMKA